MGLCTVNIFAPDRVKSREPVYTKQIDCRVQNLLIKSETSHLKLHLGVTTLSSSLTTTDNWLQTGIHPYRASVALQLMDKDRLNCIPWDKKLLCLGSCQEKEIERENPRRDELSDVPTGNHQGMGVMYHSLLVFMSYGITPLRSFCYIEEKSKAVWMILYDDAY